MAAGVSDMLAPAPKVAEATSVRVDSHGLVILAPESIEAIAARVVEECASAIADRVVELMENRRER